MRTFYFVVPAFAFCCLLLIGGAGCKKNNSISGSGCITRDAPMVTDNPPSSGVTVADLDTVRLLAAASHISLRDFQVTFFVNTVLLDSTGALFNAFDLRQFINGLPVLGSSAYYSFTNGKLTDSSIADVNGIPQTSDTAAHLTLEDVRKLFLSSGPDKYTYQNIFKKNTTHWADSCITATLVYQDKAVSDNSNEAQHILVRTWSIHQSVSGYDNTLATIVDETGQVHPTPSPVFTY